MTNKDKMLKDIERLNESHDMDFNKWMMWGITQIVFMTAMILDNVENMEHTADMRGEE